MRLLEGSMRGGGTLVKTLRPGRYRVRLQARDAAGNRSNTSAAAFKIVS